MRCANSMNECLTNLFKLPLYKFTFINTDCTCLFAYLHISSKRKAENLAVLAGTGKTEIIFLSLK